MIAAWWFGIQAMLGLLWWAWMALAPAARAPFAPPGQEGVLLAFWPADLLIIGGSAAACAGGRRAPWAKTAAWVATASLAYATLYCIGLVLHAAGPWLPVLVMLPAVAVSAAAARRL